MQFFAQKSFGVKFGFQVVILQIQNEHYIEDERVELNDGIGQKSSNGKNVDHYDGICRSDIMPTLPRAILVACDGYAIYT